MINKIIYWLPYIPIIGIIWLFLPFDIDVCVFDENDDINNHFWLTALVQSLSISLVHLGYNL